jgi:prepilin-type processing-associated H-X9-DG protein
MPANILGIGSAFPARQLSQPDAARIVARLSCENPQQRRLLETIFRKAEVHSRGCVLLDPNSHDEQALGFYAAEPDHAGGPGTAVRMKRYARESMPLAAAAARAALDQAKFDAHAITHLITVSCTGFFAPGLDVGLIAALGLRPSIARTHVGFMGCHGALNAMQVARAFVRADPDARVLLSATELCSLHFQSTWNADNIVANALFADGSAALALGTQSAPEKEMLSIAATASFVVPESQDAMSWTVGDHGFSMTLSARVPDLIAQHLPDFLKHWLNTQGLSVDDIGSWIVHPGGTRILSAVESALKLPAAALALSRQVLAEQGNMSSPTVLIILQRLLASPVKKPIALLAFGPGLVVEAALLT